jgi:SAM-dependent methyltransferase
MRELGMLPDGVLYRCQLCGSFYLDCLIDSTVSETESYGSSYREGHDAAKSPRLFEIFCKAAVNTNGLPRTLLDVGCGDGAFLELAKTEGWEVCGLDSDLGAVQLAHNRQLSALGGRLGESLPLIGAFSVITLWDVIEHISAIDDAMNWLASSVAVGGILIILTPNSNCTLDWLAHVERTISFHKSQRIMHLCLNRYHRRRFTVQGLKRLVSRFGFVTEDVSTVQLFSLSPEKYLSGFAPGMPGWTESKSLNILISKACYRAIKVLGIRNKILLTCRKSARANLEPTDKGASV